MDCSEAKTRLSAFASGLTNDLDRAEIETHIASCEECSLEVELLRGRASGKGARPPQSDWTIEKIFGGGGGAAETAGAGAAPSETPMPAPPEGDSLPSDDALEVRAPASAPPETPTFTAPSPSPPSMILPPPEPDSEPLPASGEGQDAKGKKKSWDFEPADASREAKPPEESVVLAEQALKRKGGAALSPKAAARRVLIWSVGGITGLGLLGVSIWIVMAVQQAPPSVISTGAVRSQAEPDSADSVPPGETASDSPPSTTPDAQALQARTLPAPESVTPEPVGTPPAVTAPAAPIPAASKTMAVAPAKSGTASRGAENTRKGASNGPAAPASASLAPRVAGAAPTTHTTSTSSTLKTPKHDDDDMWPTDDPVRATPSVRMSPTAKVPAKTEAPPASRHPAASDSTPAGDAPASASTPVPALELKPIDRLHVATEKATVAQDLVALRQLKGVWKTLLRTVVGPDRSRAKREYADCLWAIQAISARDADQRETLNAYRDYLLNAPAGGADPRSAERLRELEDALRERR